MSVHASTAGSDTLGLKELIAMGVGGMIGGGIFSVLGLAIDIGGKAAPLAFGLGGIVAFLAGYSYIRLALAFRSDGASFTYLERAFPDHPDIGGFVGWVVVAGYIGTLALYAFTFGAYGADLLGSAGSPAVRVVLSGFVLLAFMIINLMGVRTSGTAEDLAVYTKIALLALIGVIGLAYVEPARLTPIFDKGVPALFSAGALIFVAFEGFQLITNAVCETRDPERNVPRGIYGSIIIVLTIYVALAVIGTGNLTPAQIHAAQEYALAVAVRPALGEAGNVLVCLAALLATSSAINATIFGASRMMAEMSRDEMMPRAFSIRSPALVPAHAIVIITVLALALTFLGGLELIAAFSSMTFLLVSLAVSIANFRLRRQTRSHAGVIFGAAVLMSGTVLALTAYLWRTRPDMLAAIVLLYATVLVIQLVFRRRQRFIARR